MQIFSTSKILSILLMAPLVFGCVKEEELPEYILPDEQVIRVLIHAHLLESKIDNFSAKKGYQDVVYKRFDSLMFIDLQVDKERYEKTIAYYADKPAKLNDLYETVVDSLSLRQKNRDIY